MAAVTPADVAATLELVDGGVGLREMSGRTSVPLTMVRALVAGHRPDLDMQLLAKAEARRAQKTAQAAHINTAERGRCSLCGHECSLMANGHPRPHNERRVRMSVTGKAETYAVKVECDGFLHPAEPLEAVGDAVS